MTDTISVHFQKNYLSKNPVLFITTASLLAFTSIILNWSCTNRQSNELVEGFVDDLVIYGQNHPSHAKGIFPKLSSNVTVQMVLFSAVLCIPPLIFR